MGLAFPGNEGDPGVVGYCCQGRSFVQTEQIYAGLLALIFAPLMRLVVKHSLNDELFYLKHECENAKRIRRKLHQHDRVP
jgi:hypothetical protein